MNCPECGAPETLCKTRFDEILVLEFTEACFGAVHHLTVAARRLASPTRIVA